MRRLRVRFRGRARGEIGDDAPPRGFSSRCCVSSRCHRARRRGSSRRSCGLREFCGLQPHFRNHAKPPAEARKRGKAPSYAGAPQTNHELRRAAAEVVEERGEQGVIGAVDGAQAAGCTIRSSACGCEARRAVRARARARCLSRAEGQAARRRGTRYLCARRRIPERVGKFSMVIWEASIVLTEEQGEEKDQASEQ